MAGAELRRGLIAFSARDVGETADIGPTLHGGEAADDFVLLYESTYPRVVRALEYAGSNRSTAEDLAQEAFARTLGHWRRVRRGTNPAGYVYRVAFRLARRQDEGGRRGVATADVAGPASPDIAVVTTLRLSASAVIECMPPARRSCALLCLVAELSPKEAGRALGIAESTVRKQLERAREDLRAALGG
jgi:RNA polymerase sigma factor (sigma-70 family)